MSASTPGNNTVIGGGGFHHIAIRVRDFDKSLNFYQSILGCQPKISWHEKPKRAVMLDTGDGNYIELFERPDQAPATGEGVLLHLALRTTNIDESIARVRGFGCEVTIEPNDLVIDSKPFKTPVRLAFFKGPDGEVIEFFQNELT